MRLADQYPPEELPTRPDNSRACATRCAHCGQVFGDHAISVPPVPPSHMWESDCFGLRSNFEGAKTRHADAER